MPNGIRIFSGSANPALCAAICEELNLTPGEILLKRFADKELYPQYIENIRGSDVFLIQPTCAPVNDNLMELILMVNAAKLASAKRIVAVLPYYGYARQDRKDRPRVPISAQVVATMLQAVGVDRVLSLDLHSAPIQGFFNIPVDHLYALPVFAEHLNSAPGSIDLIVSPDVGGVARARLMATKLNLPLAIIDKFREAANVSKVMNVIGDVQGKNCLLVDDLIDTAGTLCAGATALLEHGAKSVRAAVSHGLFSFDHKNNESAFAKIDRSPLLELWVTDSIDQSINKEACCKIHSLTVAALFAKAIQAVHEDTSVTTLFL